MAKVGAGPGGGAGWGCGCVGGVAMLQIWSFVAAPAHQQIWAPGYWPPAPHSSPGHLTALQQAAQLG